MRDETIAIHGGHEADTTRAVAALNFQTADHDLLGPTMPRRCSTPKFRASTTSGSTIPPWTCSRSGRPPSRKEWARRPSRLARQWCATPSGT